jgi:hypothetical protein
MPAANLFDAAASVCGILLRRHLERSANTLRGACLGGTAR